MLERTLFAALVLIALLSAVVYGFYVSVVPVLVFGGVVLSVTCAGALALAAGWLGRWVEVYDER